MSGVSRMSLVFEDGLTAVSCNEMEPDSCNGCSFNSVADAQSDRSKCRSIKAFGLDCSVQEIIWKTVQ